MKVIRRQVTKSFHLNKVISKYLFGHDMNPNSDIYTVAICTGTSTFTEKKDIKIDTKKILKRNTRNTIDKILAFVM